MSPFANIMAPPKLVSKVAQIGIITNHEEPLNEDNDSSERKHNPRMPQIIPFGKPYNEQRGRPSGQLEMVVGFLPVDGTYL